MEPAVSIVIVNYNSGPALRTALETLSRLTYPAFDCIVVDNASSDDSLSGIASFPASRIIRLLENSGFAAGANRGLEEAFRRGAKYAWLFNPDAEATPETLSRLVAAAEMLGRPGLLSPVIRTPAGAIWFAGGYIRFGRMRVTHRIALPETSLEPYATDFITGCAPLISRSLWETIGGFDERFFLYYEDADYSRRARKAGFALSVVPAAEVLHAEQSEASANKTYFLVLSGLLFFEKYARGPWRLWIALYVKIRRFKNALDRLLGRPRAELVARAYRDFARRSYAHPADFPHLR